MIEQQEQLIAEMAVENAELREELKAKEAELDQIRNLPENSHAMRESMFAFWGEWGEPKWRDREPDPFTEQLQASVIAAVRYAISTALASPAARPATDTDVGTKARQIDIEDQINSEVRNDESH